MNGRCLTAWVFVCILPQRGQPLIASVIVLGVTPRWGSAPTGCWLILRFVSTNRQWMPNDMIQTTRPHRTNQTNTARRIQSHFASIIPDIPL